VGSTSFKQIPQLSPPCRCGMWHYPGYPYPTLDFGVWSPESSLRGRGARGRTVANIAASGPSDRAAGPAACGHEPCPMPLAPALHVTLPLRSPHGLGLLPSPLTMCHVPLHVSNLTPPSLSLRWACRSVVSRLIRRCMDSAGWLSRTRFVCKAGIQQATCRSCSWPYPCNHSCHHHRWECKGQGPAWAEAHTGMV
jgi:hypothetical protein